MCRRVPLRSQPAFSSFALFLLSPLLSFVRRGLTLPDNKHDGNKGFLVKVKKQKKRELEDEKAAMVMMRVSRLLWGSG